MVNTFKFGFYSFIGILFFLVPVGIGGESAMLLGHMKTYIVDGYQDLVKILATGFAVVTIFGTAIGMTKKSFNDKALDELFITTKFISILRIIGAATLIVITYNFLPENLEKIIADETWISLLTTCKDFFFGQSVTTASFVTAANTTVVAIIFTIISKFNEATYVNLI